MATAWSSADDDALRRMHGTRSIGAVAESLGRSKCSVRARITRLGICKRDDYWTDAEIEMLRAAYADVTVNADLDLAGVADRLGRNKANVCRKARHLGLTNHKRAGVHARKDRRKFKTAEELRAAQSAAAKRRLAENGHPRGMAGKRHTDATKDRLRETTAAAQAALSPEERSARVTKSLQSRMASQGSLAPNHKAGSWRAGWREIGGKRNYYRSRWEANYARYLEWLKGIGEIADWQHEPETFWFDAIKRGVRSYLPDFRVWENDGSSKLHEVKGWMDNRSKTTLARMKRYHPQETIILIRERDYNSIARQAARMIEGWEHSDRADRP